jgi:cell division protein FtsL
MKRKQARKSIPWRSKVRITSRTIVAALALLIVGGLYLAVNARVADAGREVLVLQNQQAELQRQIAELTSTMAELTMPQRMLERALALGYEPADMSDMIYIPVQGYVPPAEFVAPRPPASQTERQGSLSPAYTETLGEWFLRVVRPDQGTAQ